MQLSRWKIFVKWFLTIPHYIILAMLTIVVAVTTIISFFAILFTGHYPSGLFRLAVGYLRYGVRVCLYVTLLRDEYPPFRLSDESGESYPIDLEVPYPEVLSRWKIFVKWLLAVPHWIILLAISAAAVESLSLTAAITLVAFFAILFTTRYPAGLFELSVGIARWGLRVVAYVMLLRDDYPPFRLSL
ncbi:MAG: DUF4389 domain-containing protein [Dehalococcoidia bacterium]|nr:DUF4389 domain-containing protein [Dehalococcoidia bacterium]